jgi:hypothetical protein
MLMTIVRMGNASFNGMSDEMDIVVEKSFKTDCVGVPDTLSHEEWANAKSLLQRKNTKGARIL